MNMGGFMGAMMKQAAPKFKPMSRATMRARKAATKKSKKKE